MKIGILTFHSQINYGGVLQCLALQRALEDLGHDVKVIDLWMHPHCVGLDGVFSRGLGFKRRLKMIVQSILWPRMAARQLRHRRTRLFVDRYLHLTDYHFLEWKDAPRDLGVDLIVVGSDQVWHCGDFGDPRPYLLEGAPKVRAIAYAASFGIRAYPDGMLGFFREGFKRFAAISVRESSAVKLVEEVGAKATHVVDPTLLVNPQFWQELQPRETMRSADIPRRIVCYFIRQDVEDAMPALERFGRQNDCRFDIITTQLKPHVGTKTKLWNYCMSLLGAYPHVHIRTAVGPAEFLELFANADASITDSFHALMFSSIYDLNCRVLRPQGEYLRGMFARLEEFAGQTNGVLISPDVDSALSSFARQERTQYCQEKIEAWRAESVAWLQGALSS